MISVERGDPFLEHEADELTAYLTDLYQGVFTHEAIKAHLDNHIGYAFADYACEVMQMYLGQGASVLDIGSGFGSFVTTARLVGFEAYGIEIAASEVEFARKRLNRELPDEDTQAIFLTGDATELKVGAKRYDAVTCWNVLEHIENSTEMLETASQLLKPNGFLFVICPNYNANRDEAHYHIPWLRKLRHDRDAVARYIESVGRNPTYFNTSIFCRTNWEVLRDLRALGFDAMELGTKTPLWPIENHLLNALRSPMKTARFVNPHKESVMIAARKR